MEVIKNTLYTLSCHVEIWVLWSQHSSVELCFKAGLSRTVSSSSRQAWATAAVSTAEIIGGALTLQISAQAFRKQREGFICSALRQREQNAFRSSSPPRMHCTHYQTYRRPSPSFTGFKEHCVIIYSPCYFKPLWTFNPCCSFHAI